MKNKLVVVSKGASFIAGVLIKSLINEDYEAVLTYPGKNDLKDAALGASGLVLCLGSYVEDGEVMEYIGELMHRTGIKAVLIGSTEQIDKAMKYLPENKVVVKNQEHCSVKSIASALDIIFSDEEAAKPRRSILLVDDDPTFLKMMRSWLAEDYAVVPVTGGRQALQYLSKKQPDLILLDYEMPELDGPQVLESIRSQDTLKDIPVFFLTGVDSRESVTKAISLKPEGYLLKHNDKQKLLKTISDFFESH
ncbi:MAG: response regulator [Succinivibrio sp.]|nr:response regulator [Succinivibrio sp.]